jgi:hypothetical protein
VLRATEKFHADDLTLVLDREGEAKQQVRLGLY